LGRYSLVSNEPDATQRVIGVFRKHFGSDRVRESKPTSASEDFGVFGAAWQTPSLGQKAAKSVHFFGEISSACLLCWLKERIGIIPTC